VGRHGCNEAAALTVTGDPVPTAAELLDELRREWRAHPDQRAEIARTADAVKLLDLILRPDTAETRKSA
jgi:hypothetical protein